MLSVHGVPGAVADNRSFVLVLDVCVVVVIFDVDVVGLAPAKLPPPRTDAARGRGQQTDEDDEAQRRQEEEDW